MKTIFILLALFFSACNNDNGKSIEKPVIIELWDDGYYTVTADTLDYYGVTLFISPDLNENIKDCNKYGYTIVAINDMTCK